MAIHLRQAGLLTPNHRIYPAINGPALGFVILVSILLDIGVQLNTWRILTISGLRAQDLSNQLLPGLGYFFSY